MLREVEEKMLHWAAMATADECLRRASEIHSNMMTVGWPSGHLTPGAALEELSLQFLRKLFCSVKTFFLNSSCQDSSCASFFL